MEALATSWFPLVRRLSPHAPIVLVGCKVLHIIFASNWNLTLQADGEATHDQGMDKSPLHSTPMDFHNTPTPMDAVMHVETSAKTSAKSVLIAFQVRGPDNL